MFKKVKINYTQGKLRQIRFFDLPIFQYELTNEGKLKSVVFPLFRKPKKDKPVVYLKFNSTNYAYSLWCLHHWISIVNTMGYDFYIICDKPAIEYKILEKVPFMTSNIKFIKSDRKSFKKEVNFICDRNWKNAAHAHLTTFIHAKANNIKEFWNIDADDTSFFEEPQNIKVALNKAEEYARKNNIEVFSLDMHRSMLKGKHWSFGIAFIKMSDKVADCLKSTKNVCWCDKLKEILKVKELTNNNLDWYFTYLKETNKLNIETFAIDNLYFAHWGFSFPIKIKKLIYVLKNHYLELPFAHSLTNKDEKILLYKDVVEIVAGINENESKNFMNKIFDGYDYKIDYLFNFNKDA